MNQADQYVTPEARYAEEVDAQSGVRHQVQGAPPYPLYGLSEGELQPLPIWQRPWFCYAAGAVGGVGLSYAIWRWALPMLGIKLGRVKKNKKNGRTKKKTEADE
jgi:hypothetical protein